MSKKTIKRLMTYLKNYKGRLAIVVILIIISSIAGVIPSLFWQVLIDSYISPLLLTKNPDFSGLLKILFIMCSVYTAGVLSELFYNRLMAVVSQGTLKNIRDEMFEKMQKFPVKFFDSNSNGDIMSHYTNDTDALRQMISMVVPQVFSFFISIITMFISMLILSLWMTLFVAVCVILMTFIIIIIGKKSKKYFFEQQKSLGDLNGYIEEMINGQKVVKVFNYEKRATEKFEEKNQRLNFNATTANKYVNIIVPVMSALSYVLYVLIAVFGGAMALSGLTNYSLSGTNILSLGTIAAFLLLSRRIVMPIAQVMQQMNAIILALAGADRIFRLIDSGEENDNGFITLVNVENKEDVLLETEKKTGLWAWKIPSENGNILYKMLEGEVVFDEVDFEYNAGEPILRNISLFAKPGQKIAFVGATGAGKTTITNLINRFYDIADGKIRYDGININKIKKEDLRRSLAIVLQDVNLFTGSVMDNIRYGNLEATDEECIAAAKLANADSFIRMLPYGYNTILEGDGSGLSQGQRQLISIARAAVADPPVMILDEATSSIDTRTEEIVQKGMDSIMKGRTVFVIAHRLSTVKNSDVIMVLDHGEIIERGSHENLIAQRGTYYQLYTGAFELE